MPSVSELHEATPAEAAKWRFVNRRTYATFIKHGYCEVQPPVLEPEGTSARAGSGAALALGDGTELRGDLQAALARLAARSPPLDTFVRWMTVGDAFDPEPVGPYRFRAWQAVGGLILGCAAPAADAEVAAHPRVHGRRYAQAPRGGAGDPRGLAVRGA